MKVEKNMFLNEEKEFVGVGIGNVIKLRRILD
jgi:hypothetical protein